MTDSQFPACQDIETALKNGTPIPVDPEFFGGYYDGTLAFSWMLNDVNFEESDIICWPLPEAPE